MSAYRFGSIELQPDQRRLIVDGRDATLGSRAFDVLMALARRPGQLVTKNELLDEAWPGLVVEENNVQVQISTLRKLLGPHAIATIPGRGYRLTLAPHEASAQAPPPERGAAAVPAGDVAPSDELTDPPALYGRTEDLAALSDLIRRHGLVTLVGPAGIGKTRLAQSVGRRLETAFADGVQVVEFAALADPALVVVTVARALGLASGGGQTALELAVQALAGQRLLLVLDNCEHVLDAVDAMVAALRKGAPGVHILATSQEVLRHPDEYVYRLASLALPDASTVSSASAAGAVELFVARAAAVEPRFMLSDANVAATVEICRRLDGIPLAIELAAARVPLLGVEGVRERLDERFRLLTAGSRLALRRHQTLRAALEWSYGLLSEQEKSVFDLLGVFAGTFSLAAVQELVADEAMDEWAVLDHLGALVDKSLVTVDGGESPRYRMLETTRAFALERLAARGGTRRAMRRHAEVMLGLFERFHDEHFHGMAPAKAADELVADHDNLRGALTWASEEGGDRRIAAALLGAAGSTMGYLRHVALRAEAWDLCERVRPVVDDSIPAAVAARFWLACAEHGGDAAPSESIEHARRAIALYRDLDDRRGMYLASKALAFSLLQTGRSDEAKRAMEDALGLRDPAWPLWVRGLIDNTAALVYSQIGALGPARHHAAEFLAVARRTGSYREERTALAILADIDLAAGNTGEAAATASEALARYPPWGRRSSELSSDRSSDGLGLRIFATALMSDGRLDQAESLYREALTRVKRSYGTSAPVLYDAATLLARRGRIDDAARVWAYAERFYSDSGRSPRQVARQLGDRLLTLLAAERTDDVLARLYDEGRRLTDDEACALAFPSMSPEASR